MPPGEFLVSTGVEVPSDSRGIPFWRPLEYVDHEPQLPDAAAFSIDRLTSDGRRHRVGVELEMLTGPLIGGEPLWPRHLILISPRGGFQPEGQYLFAYAPRHDRNLYATDDPYYDAREVVVLVSTHSLAEAAGGRATLHVGEPARQEIGVETRCGSCGTRVDASLVDITLELPPSARRWQDVLLFTTTVDGEVWRPTRSLCSTVPPGRSWIGNARERLFADCGAEERRPCAPSDDLGTGVHTVVMTAWWPGVDATISGSATVDLTCNAAVSRTP